MRNILGATALVGLLLFGVGCGSDPGTDTGGQDTGGNDTGTDTTGTDTGTDTTGTDTTGDDTKQPGDMTGTDTAPTDMTGDMPKECAGPDVTGAPKVTIEVGDVTPAGTGGEITTGRWLLQSALLDAPIPVEGTLQAVLDVAATNATSGNAGVRLVGTITAPVMTDFDQGGLGSYTTADNDITIAAAPGCSDPPIEMGEYTVDGDELTLWATLTVMNIPVSVEAVFQLE